MKSHQRQKLMFDDWLALHHHFDNDDDIKKAGFDLPEEECFACDGMGTVGNNYQECDRCLGSGKADNNEVHYNYGGKLSSEDDMWIFFMREQKVAQLKINDYVQFRSLRQNNLMHAEEPDDTPQLSLC